MSVLGCRGGSEGEVSCDSCEIWDSEVIRTDGSCWSSCGLGDRDLSLGVGDAFFVKHEGLVWGGGRVNSRDHVLTFKRSAVRGGGLLDFVGLSIGASHVVGVCAGHITVARGAGVDLFNDEMRDWGTTGSDWSIGLAHMRGTAASGTIGHDFDLVRDGILGSDVVGFGSGDFAMSGFVVDLLNTSHRNGQGTVATSNGRRVGWSAL